MDQQNAAPDTEDTSNEDLEVQQNKIADQLSELSKIQEFPSGFRSTYDPFEPADVDFGSSGWLLRTLQVHAWMNPNEEMDARAAEADPVACAIALFSAIGAEEAGQCVYAEGSTVRLTSRGAEYLAARLDSGTRLQGNFSESLETLTKKQASAQWRDEWEEEGDVEAPSAEPIRAKTDQWGINDFSGRAERGALNLSPSYQRGDVWPTSDAQKLIESILRGIPLPSIILLKPASRDRQAKYEVVDGKQRLTSILRFIGQHPGAVERVKSMDAAHPGSKLAEHFSKEYKKFRRVWKNVTGESLTDKREAAYYFPFRLPQNSRALQGRLSSLAGKYYCEIRDLDIGVGEGLERVSDVFERTSGYKIPLIEYIDASPPQIHEVFHLYNRQGKHLNAEEIRNALYHDVDLVRLVLVASGDNPAVDELAPYIAPTDRQRLTGIAKCLEDYRFGSARYRRTKLLSWLYALLFQPSVSEDVLAVKSTAKQIDALFISIRGESGQGISHRLSDKAILSQLVRDTDRCLDAHSSADCWESGFKDDDRGLKWQELQLVASLVAVFLIGVLEESVSDVLDLHRDELLAFTRAHPRPEKTQNKEQWAFIGEVALGLLRVVGADEGRLELQLSQRYGANCLPTLRAAQALFRPGR